MNIGMIIAADDRSLELMLRAPLEAMRDVDFPISPEGYLVLDEAQKYLEEAAGLWLVDNLELRERGLARQPERIEVRVALPGDRAFTSLAAARRHFAEPPLPDDTRIFWRQAALDLRLQYALDDTPQSGDLSLDARLRHLGESTRVELLFVSPDGNEQVLAFDGEARGLALMPSPWQVAGDFLREGFLHILGGIDHLLFLLCLILPLRELWPVVKAVTAFTVAHSITLGAAALGWIPTPLWFASAVEAVIALSIVVLALENILRSRFSQRWATAFVFGLFHGFGFASALADTLQFAQGQLLMGLATFNLGVELGQLLVLAVALPIVVLLLRRVPSERIAIIVFSTLIAHTAWHWMSERLDTLQGYFF
ncbi:MAG: HupE/UreJ family protein [Halieaceae bacterium]|nr:HupE/UreJ family protein [Halieaceae bacterium]